MRAIFAFVCLSSVLLAQSVVSHKNEPTIPKFEDVNPQLLQLVVQDQWDRGNDMFGEGQVKATGAINWKEVGEHDEQRHAKVRKMIAEGGVQTGRDYYFSGLIFQHSEKPDDLMLAHILAVTAVAKGVFGAKYMAAATMDRYLQSIKQPQVFGTQFSQSSSLGWTMEPYNNKTLTDAERALWCVVPFAQQEKVLHDFRNGKPLAGTQLPNCR